MESTNLIGGGYGAATEKRMMKELMHGGAIEGEVDFAPYAGAYKTGILTKADHDKMM